MSENRRVILVYDSLLLHGMLKRVLDKTDQLEIVAETDIQDLDKVIQDTNADWVILHAVQNEKDSRMLNNLMQAHPMVRFLTVTKDGSQVEMKWLEPHEKNLSNLSLAEILKVLVEKR